jgi:hypothetical protein
MTAPTLYVSKDPAPAAGQPQTYSFYYLTQAIDVNGNPVEIRQPAGKSSVAILNATITGAQARLALIAALPA